MENQTMLSKTIGLHRTAFANTLEVFSTLQQHGENLLKTTLEQSPWLPKSSKNACLYYVDFYSKYLENLKSLADQGFAEIERISSPGSKPEKKESQQTKTTERILAPRPAKKSPPVKNATVSTKKTEVTITLPGEKPDTLNPRTEKTVIQNRPEVKKSEEVKATASIPKPSVTNQQTVDPVLGNTESANKLLR
jgi:hypothetical protein